MRQSGQDDNYTPRKGIRVSNNVPQGRRRRAAGRQSYDVVVVVGGRYACGAGACTNNMNNEHCPAISISSIASTSASATGHRHQRGGEEGPLSQGPADRANFGDDIRRRRRGAIVHSMSTI